MRHLYNLRNDHPDKSSSYLTLYIEHILSLTRQLQALRYRWHFTATIKYPSQLLGARLQPGEQSPPATESPIKTMSQKGTSEPLVTTWGKAPILSVPLSLRDHAPTEGLVDHLDVGVLSLLRQFYGWRQERH